MLLWQPLRYRIAIVIKDCLCHKNNGDDTMFLYQVWGYLVTLVTTEICYCHSNHEDSTMFLQQPWCYHLTLVTIGISHCYSNLRDIFRHIHVSTDISACSVNTHHLFTDICKISAQVTFGKIFCLESIV